MCEAIVLDAIRNLFFSHDKLQNLFNVDFSTLNLSDDIRVQRHILYIQLLGKNGITCLDTGAKRRIAGTQILHIWMSPGHPSTSATMNIKLANGETQTVINRLSDVDNEAEGCQFPT